MAQGRALLTDAERKALTGEKGDQRRYEATSRVRARMRDELTEDVDLFAEHNQDLLDELRSIVCDGE